MTAYYYEWYLLACLHRCCCINNKRLGREEKNGGMGVDGKIGQLGKLGFPFYKKESGILIDSTFSR